MLEVEEYQIPPPEKSKKDWVQPRFTVYGDMASLTQQHCTTHLHEGCKPKTRGLGDDFGMQASTL